MTNLKRAALEIRTIGFYDSLLQDVLKKSDKTELTEKDIERFMVDHPYLLEDYRRLNVENNISNIHLKDIDDSKYLSHENEIRKINKNLQFLRDNEKYTLDFEQSSTIIGVMSVEFFVLFSVQYFIVLLDMKEWQWQIYSLFALSIVGAIVYSKKQSKLYLVRKNEFENVYEETLLLIEKLESQNILNRKDLLIYDL
jgi:hypothetical protein